MPRFVPYFLTFLLICPVLLFAQSENSSSKPVLTAPAGTLYAQIRPDGVTVIPNGRLLTPYGKQLLLEPHPYGLALSADGSVLVTVNSGVDPFSLSIVRDPFSKDPQVSQIPEGVHTDAGVLNACFMGVAFAPDQENQILYASGGDDGSVMVWDINQKKRVATIRLNARFKDRRWADSYTGALVLSKDGSRLYVVDQMNFRVVVIDTASKAIVDVIPVGRYPFGICLSPDEKTLWVANIGMFEYSALVGFDPERFEETSIPFAPFAYLSDEMINGVTVGNLYAKGLGDPNDPRAVSVYAIDLSNKESGKVVSRIKTGVLIGDKVEDIPALGGAAPNSMVCDAERVYVSNGHNDSITVIDARSHEIIHEIRILMPEPLDRLRGVIPFGLALSQDGKRLYVAESGINAVGVIDTKTYEVVGHIPVGWFPSKVAVSPDGKFLAVANAKGYGAGPNGGPGVDLGDRRGIGNLMRGTLSIFKIPTDNELFAETAQVITNNVHIGFSRPWDNTKEKNPIPPYPGAYDSPIKYVVFISKENRTYDQVFGELKAGRGEPSLADFGMDAEVRSYKRKDDVVEHVNVMPNHQILARRYACSDNFYCDSDHSCDGHRWLQGVYPGVYCETSTSASYGGRRRGSILSSAPGRGAVTGANAGLIPEDYIESGTLWDHWDYYGVSFYNFGMGFEFPANEEDGGDAYKFSGIRTAGNYPIPAPLFDRTSRRYATFNTNIPDQFRVDMFLKDFDELWASGKEPFPQVITMMLPNDHGAGERPDDGYPYGESFMADNDLALGRIIEFLSHTKYWKEMAIIITEDDAQGGRDHIDHHRSICMVVSPYAKKQHVSHVHTSIPSILKTIDLIVGIPYINQYDATASDLSDLFQATPDFTPYNAVAVNKKIFDPQKALDPYDEKFNWKSLNDFPALDNPEFIEQQRKEEAELRNRK